MTHINLRHFALMMEQLADYLDALDTATLQLGQDKSEIEADWRSEMAAYMGYQ